MSALPDLAVATVSPTHRKATVRKLTEFKIEYLITGEFLHRNKNENESSKLVSEWLTSQARKPLVSFDSWRVHRSD